MSSFALSYEQITEDLAAIEESGIDTSILAQLVKQSGVPQAGDEKGLSGMSDLIGRLAQMNAQSLEAELARVNQECTNSKESLHEAVYESGVLFLKAAEWTSKLKDDFEQMSATLQTVQHDHDFVLSLTTSNPAPR